MRMTNEIIRINIHHPVHFNWSGMFVAPDDQWIHMHRKLIDFELMVVHKGILYIEDDKGQYEIHEGEYLLMPPTQMQKGYKESDCSFYWMHFTFHFPDAYQELEMTEENLPFETGYLVIPKYGRFIFKDRVYILMQQLSDMEKRYMDLESNSFLATSVLCEMQNQIKYVRKQGGSRENVLLEKIKDHVARHISEDLHVKDIAEYFGYNEKYLTTLFRKKSNLSLKQYIIQAKMDRAKFLLCNTNASVSEIAYNLSYWNVQSFSTAFKKYTKVNPTEYRNMYSRGLINHI